VTLRDAAEYITQLPDAEHGLQHACAKGVAGMRPTPHILTEGGGFAIIDVPRNKVDQTDLLRERHANTAT
jgi:hypothetical protein